MIIMTHLNLLMCQRQFRSRKKNRILFWSINHGLWWEETYRSLSIFAWLFSDVVLKICSFAAFSTHCSKRNSMSFRASVVSYLWFIFKVCLFQKVKIYRYPLIQPSIIQRLWTEKNITIPSKEDTLLHMDLVAYQLPVQFSVIAKALQISASANGHNIFVSE